MIEKIGLRFGRWSSSIVLAVGTLSLLGSLSGCVNLPFGADSETGSRQELATSADQTEAQRRVPAFV